MDRPSPGTLGFRNQKASLLLLPTTTVWSLSTGLVNWRWVLINGLKRRPLAVFWRPLPLSFLKARWLDSNILKRTRFIKLPISLILEVSNLQPAALITSLTDVIF